jgi:DDE_Tnp_1-associated
LRVHPVIARSGFAALGAAVSGPATHDDLGEPELMCPELLRLLRQVSDGRHDQGRIHPVAVVLALCAAAVVAGMGSFTAIAGWVADVPGELLARLYQNATTSPATAPSKATIWRVVTGADAASVDAVIGAWLAAHAAAREAAKPDAEPERDSSPLMAIAVDGKTVRGALDSEGNQTHLLAAATHTDTLVLGQVEVGAKVNEIPMFAPLLNGLAAAGVDLASTVITADALCRCRHNASYADIGVMPRCCSRPWLAAVSLDSTSA